MIASLGLWAQEALALLLFTGIASAQELVPPRVVELPDIAIEGEQGDVEVVVVIDAEGHATIADCTHGEALCAAIADALARGRFEPATRDGVAIPSRIAVRLGGAPNAPSPQPPPSGREGAEAEVQPSRQPPASGRREPDGEEDAGFSARAAVAPVIPGSRRLTLQETRDLPGAFGDPFRAIDALPSVTPVLSGLPYFYVRGAPPASTLYVYDDVPVPALYHLAAGPAVIHPRMVGPVRLYAGVPPTRYGRLTGGAVVGEGPDAPESGAEGELELRLIDITGFAKAQVGDATVQIAGRYGYPALLLSIFSPAVDLAYWDYQTRIEVPIGRDTFQLIWFGSYDSFSAEETNAEGRGDGIPDRTSLTLQFHRLEARYIRRFGAFELGSAMRLGFEESSLQGDDSGDTAVSIGLASGGPRLWLAWREGTTRMRLGTELVASVGDISLGGDTMSEDRVAAPTNLTLAAVPGRTTYALYGEITFAPIEHLELTLGLRGDVWIAGGGFDGALDPRMRAVLTPRPGLEFHVALGALHQPAVFFLPIPGLSEIATDYGLQRALQGEIGAGYDLIEDLRAEVQLFVHRYDGLVFPDFFFQGDVQCGDGNNDCARIEREERVGGTSYGGEIFIRKPPGGVVNGFLSYTLAWANIDDDAVQGGFTPSYDVRHVLNAVGQVDLGAGFTAGIRLHLRSGKVLGQYYIDLDAFTPYRYEQRLPVFARLDAQVAYAWDVDYGRHRVALEFFNATLSREPVGIDCNAGLLAPPPGGCPVTYTDPIFFPNLSWRVELR